MTNGSLSVSGSTRTSSSHGGGGKTIEKRIQKVVEFIQDDKTKKVVNYATNGGASILNLFTFANGNFHFFDDAQEKLESFSAIMAKVAVGLQGLIGAADNWSKKNIVPLIGFALEIPIAIFSSDYNLWLFRGMSQGISQTQAFIKRRIVKSDEGKETEIGDTFSSFKEGFLTTCKEIPGLFKEIPQLFKKGVFEDEQTFSRSVFFVSCGQFIGGFLGLLGFQTIGAALRDFFGIGVDFAFLTDKKKRQVASVDKTRDQEEKGVSYYVIAAYVWMIAAISDFFKRFDFFSSRVNNFTSLSLSSDRGASVFYMLGNIESKSQEAIASA